MEAFNSLRSFSETFKLKDLEPGKYRLILLGKIETKYGNTMIARLDINDEEKTFILQNVLQNFLIMLSRK